MQSKFVQDQVELHTMGQAVKGINIGDVKKIGFGLPSLDEQILIAARLLETENAIHGVRLESSKLRSLKTGLMQDLLTGRKLVTPLMTAEAQG